MRRELKAFMKITKLLYILLVCSTLGCASLDITIEEKKSENYKIAVLPKYWKAIQDTQADASFSSSRSAATIFINSLCEKYNNASLDILSQNLLRGVDDVEVEVEEFVTLAKRKAKHTVAQGSLDGVQIKMNIYVLRKDYCLYDFTYTARPEHYEKDLKDFENLLRSFKTTGAQK